MWVHQLTEPFGQISTGFHHRDSPTLLYKCVPFIQENGATSYSTADDAGSAILLAGIAKICIKCQDWVLLQVHNVKVRSNQQYDQSRRYWTTNETRTHINDQHWISSLVDKAFKHYRTDQTITKLSPIIVEWTLWIRNPMQQESTNSNYGYSRYDRINKGKSNRKVSSQLLENRPYLEN